MGANEKVAAALHPGGAVMPSTTEHSPQAVAAYPLENYVADMQREAYDRGRVEALAEKRSVNREALVPAVVEALRGWTQDCNRQMHRDGDALMAAGEAFIDAIFALPDRPLVADHEAVLRHRFEQRYGRLITDQEWQDALEYDGEKLALARLDTSALFGSGVIHASSGPAADKSSTLPKGVEEL